jgi:hypothetical protein
LWSAVPQVSLETQVPTLGIYIHAYR